MQTAVLEETSVKPLIINELSKSSDGVKSYKWTRKEYYKMAELGFFQGRRVELIEGEIVEMSPMKTGHAVAIRIILNILGKIFGENYSVDSQLPMSFSATSEPDIAVVKGSIRDFSKSHPKNAELIIEVSDTTLYFDRNVKAELYARNKIRDYWILNLQDRCLEVYRQPKNDKTLGFHYAEKLIFTESDEVSPLAKKKSKIKVADILP